MKEEITATEIKDNFDKITKLFMDNGWYVIPGNFPSYPPVYLYHLKTPEQEDLRVDIQYVSKSNCAYFRYRGTSIDDLDICIKFKKAEILTDGRTGFTVETDNQSLTFDLDNRTLDIHYKIMPEDDDMPTGSFHGLFSL